MTAPTSTTTPTTPAEFEDALSDQARVNELFKNGEFGAFISNYAKAVHERDSDIGKQIKNETQRAVAEFLRNNGQVGANRLKVGDAPGTNGPAPTGAAAKALNKRAHRYNSRAVGAGIDGTYGDIVDFFQDVWHNAKPTPERMARLDTIRNYASEKVPSEGGFLVPEEFRSEIMRVALESSIVRPRARVIPMSTHKMSFPMVDTTSNVSHVFGGIVMYWTEEGAELTESAPKFARVTLEPMKLTGLTHVTNELVADWGGFGTFLDEIFPEAYAHYEDLAFLGGTGVGEPLGMLNTANGAIIEVAKETGQSAATIVWENVIRMYARMLPASLGRAVWIASPDVFAELATMALNVGTGGSAVWIMDAHSTPQLTLLGRPVIMTEKAPALLGTRGDLSLVDPGMYLIGDRQAMTIASSPHVRFTSDQTTYRVIGRVDGRPWMQSAITPKNNSATLSAFVQLATRA